ncbi:MAG: signal peptide peptidase SppA [Myxococcales bacterium]|nr:signal peptide peptidase SppA [Myxococcales bacterium]
MRSALLALALTALTTAAHAQLERATASPRLPAVSSAAPDGALALETNPAALAYVTGWDVAYVHTEALGDAALQGRGDSLYGALSLPLGLALAAGVDWVRPTDGQDARGRFSLGLAWARDRRFALGGAARFLASDGPLGGTATLDLGLSWRPTSFLSVGFAAHDLLAPTGLIGRGEGVAATFNLSAQLRPFGRDDLLLEVLGALDDRGRFGMRGLASVAVPRVGRLWGAIEGDDLRGRGVLRGLVGVDLSWENATLGGGIVLAEGGAAGWMTHARLSGATRPEGLPSVGVVDELEVRGGERGVLAVLHRLDAGRRDPRVRGVLLRMRSSGIGSAYAQELRQAIAALQAAGKPVVCHFEAPTGSELYACGPARAAFVDPAGYVRLYGPSMDALYYGELLRRIGVRADFLRIGDEKGAVEIYTQGGSSVTARARREAILDDVYARVVADLARDRDASVEDVRRWIDQGPYPPEEAEALGLVAGRRDVQQLGPDLRTLTGTTSRRTRAPSDAPRTTGVPRQIGVVVIDGTLVDGRNVDYPIIEIHQSGSDTVVAAIDALAADRSVAAIVLRIDSPGGSALASDRIWRAVRRARQRKPVIASLGAIAASGGYYVATAASEIWATPSTITGSIGIFYGKVDLAPLGEHLGIAAEQSARGRRAGAESLYRPFTPDERGVLAAAIRRWYRLFLGRVAESRGMTVEEIDARGRGRVFTGDAARELGLVDRVGGFLATLERARELANLPPDVEVSYVPSRPSTLIDYVTAGLGLAHADGASAPAPPAALASSRAPALRHALELAATIASTEEGVPLAMLPVALTP